MQLFKEKAIGDELDGFSANIVFEIKKEFSLLKNRCMVETRKRCEALVREDIGELTMAIK